MEIQMKILTKQYNDDKFNSIVKQWIVKDRLILKTEDKKYYTSNGRGYYTEISEEDVIKYGMRSVKLLNLQTPEPISFSAFIEGRYEDVRDRQLLIDDADHLLRCLAKSKGSKIKAITITPNDY